MIKTYPGLLHLNGNLLAAVDFETTGRRAGYHEPIQLAVVPLGPDLRPLEGVRPFYTATGIKPEYPERCERSASVVHGLDINELVLHAPEPGVVIDLLMEWFYRLDLPFNKRLVPLAHNWAFESAFFKAWLGLDRTEELFHGHARDSMLLAASMNDKAMFAGEQPPFNWIGLQSLCKKFGIENPKEHDAYCDAVAEAEVYRALLHYDLF